MTPITPSTKSKKDSATERLLEGLTAKQHQAVVHDQGPLLILAGAGTGKTTVITRRIAWLLATEKAKPEEILALTFSEKAASEMEERVDLLVPYGYLDITIRTFHAFGDAIIREYAHLLGLSPYFNVYSQSEQELFLKEFLFNLPLKHLRPLNDPGRYLGALLTLFGRAKDELVSEDEFLSFAKNQKELLDADADIADQVAAERFSEMAQTYREYHRLMRKADAVDFGDQVFLAIKLLEENETLRKTLQKRYRYILVDEFQDTNYGQYRLLELLAPKDSNVTVVADDDQSIYKWRGAALSNVLKYLESYHQVEMVVLTENFRCTQPILDRAYKLIRFNDPDRLEVKQGIDKRLTAEASDSTEDVHFHIFDTVGAEADWVANTIRELIEKEVCHPKDIAVLVRSNREADPFIRALNLSGVPWQFSGASGLFAREEAKMLLSCLKVLADSEDALSWYHVAASDLYTVPMADLIKVLAVVRKTHVAFREVVSQAKRADMVEESDEQGLVLSVEGSKLLDTLIQDVDALQESARRMSCGQILYQWLADRGFLEVLAKEESTDDIERLSIVARFFDQLRRVEQLAGSKLVEVIEHIPLFEALGQDAPKDDDIWADRVQVLTLHKSKGLEFPVVFMVGLVQNRFPSIRRRDVLELPQELIKDEMPEGDYHLQEERRLFYVGMTRAKKTLHMTSAYNYGGKTTRKVSQFVMEALNLSTPSPPARVASAKELINRSAYKDPLPTQLLPPKPVKLVRLDPHGLDDYMTCPLKYRYSHILRIPVMRHHVVGYGSAIHKAIEIYYVQQLKKAPLSEEEFLALFEREWSSDGYISREHEALRKEQGLKTLKRFYAEQQKFPEDPTLIEAPFKFVLDDKVLVAGRWDRIDCTDAGAVIVDYKTSDVKEEKAAHRKAKDSTQLQVYSLAWQMLKQELPIRAELRFVETGLVGVASFEEKHLTTTRKRLLQAAEGIKAQHFDATPNEFDCRWCAYQAICPKSALRK